MKTIFARTGALAGILLVAIMGASQAANLKDIEITDEFPWERCADSVGLVNSCFGAYCNPYLPLIVGRVQELDNSECDDCEEFEAVAVSMLADTQLVNGQTTRIMEEREWVGEFGEEPELAEVSRNFVIMCPNTQDVFYFGEDVCLNAEDEDALEEPLYAGHYDCTAIGMLYGTGAWRAGLGDDEPGLLFPGGTFLLNATYFQELAGIALDWAMNAETGLSEADFDDCVMVLDRNLLEDPKSKEDGDEKIYCPDIGIVKDEELEFVSCTDIGDVDCEQ
jgi:hypothetical protein